LGSSLRIALVDCEEDAGAFGQGWTTILAGGSVLVTIQIAIGRRQCSAARN
jgi:hypothetical protein